MNKGAYLYGFNEYKKGVFEMIEEQLMDELESYFIHQRKYFYMKQPEDRGDGWIDFSDWWSKGIKFETVSSYNSALFRSKVAKWWDYWSNDNKFQMTLELQVGLDPKIVWDELNQLVFDCIWKVAGYPSPSDNPFKKFMNWNKDNPLEVKN